MARRRAAFLLIALALGLWTALTFQTSSSIFGRVPLLDERHYLQEAAALESGPADAPHFLSPLYPRLLNLLGAGMGPEQDVLEPGQRGLLPWFQGLLWLASALLLRGCVDRLWPQTDPRWCWLPSAFFLLHAPLLVYGQMALVEMPLVFLVTLSFYLWLDPRRSLWRAAGLGAAVGLAVLLRGSLGVLALLVLLQPGPGNPPRRGRGLEILLFLGVLLLVTAPAIRHNSLAAGRLGGPTLNGGLNLYLGNGPEATGLGAGFSTEWQDDPAGLAELSRRMGRPVTEPAEADALWTRLAWRAMAGDPLRTLGLWLRKMQLQLQGWQMDQITSLAGWRSEVGVLSVAFLPWSVPVILAVTAILAGWGAVQRPVAWLLLLMATQALFFVVHRYRMVLLPLLCLLALPGVLALAQGTGPSRRRALVGLVLGAMLVFPWGLDEEREIWASLAPSNHAQRWAILASETGEPADWAEAARLYEQSVARSPALPGPWLGYAAVQRARGLSGAADAVLERGLVVAQPSAPLRRALLSTHLQAGRPAAAETQARALLAERPADAVALHNLAVLLAGQGRRDEAVNLARRLIEAHPADPQGYLDLGVLLAREGRRREAAEVFRQGLQAVPGEARLQENLRRLEKEP